MKLINLIDQKFGRWTVIARAESNARKETCWLCRCDCGIEKIHVSGALRYQLTLSCGCYRDELASQRAMTHGATKGKALTPEFISWRGAKQRCFNSNNPRYQDYGARGIIMCERWRQSFQSFLADMGPCPDGHSLDRINNNGNYEPTNCRWATRQEQNKNQRPRRKRLQAPPPEQQEARIYAELFGAEH